MRLQFIASSLLVTLMAGCSGYPTSASRLPSQAVEDSLRSKETSVAAQASERLFSERDELESRISRSSPERVESIELDPPTLDALSDKIVDVNVVDASLTDVLRLLSDQLKMNLVVDPAISKLETRATLTMRRVPAKSVLADVFRTYDISGSIRGRMIYASLMKTKTYDVGMLSASTSLAVDEGGDVFGGNSKQNSSQLKGTTTLKVESNTKEGGYDELTRVLQGILADEQPNSGSKPGVTAWGAFTLDRHTGTLFVSARPSRMRAIDKLVSNLVASRHRQIQIEAQVIDVTLNDAYQLGVDWTLLTNKLVGRLGQGVTTINSATTPFAGGLAGRTISLPAVALGSQNSVGGGLAYSSNSFSAAVNALRTFGTIRMLSNPVVRVKNGVPAYLSVGQNIRYVSKINSTVNNIGGSSSTTSTDVETDSLFSGIVIGVAATASDDGRIELFVRPMQTQVQSNSLALVSVGNGNSVTLPIVDMKGMTTSLNVNNGDTVIIGGLIDENSNTSNQGLPGLADIPLLGHIFDNATSSRANRELVLVIRARVQ
ncbi:pilus (MSHA type) biogenesis protein MshL [Burkholderia gladioli]|uniref:pilus (MSHA type) biogenesis protein MshL n=1 Tax=Burkholderia gladioli TaxID=28095 RepID=UPI003F7A03CC